jgi:hypothetical protein
VSGEPRTAERRVVEEQVRRVRLGSGANCSSIGSVVDTLFATATVGAVIFAAVVAALRAEPVRVVELRDGERRDGDDEPRAEDAP